MTIAEKLRLMDAIKKANDERWERFAAEQKERATLNMEVNHAI